MFCIPSRATPSRAALLAALLGSTLCPPVLADLDPSLAPGGNFAMENWSLTVPGDGAAGGATTIQPHQLSGGSGYRSRWFYTADDGAMTFWTPLNGATLGGSSSPRTELREMLQPGSTHVNWDVFATSILDAQVRVLQVPSDGKVIVGQAHGHGAAPLIMVYYQYDKATGTGRVIGKFQFYPELGPPYYYATLARNVDLGERFSYQLKVTYNGEHGIAWASANDGTPGRMDIRHDWNDETLYFKAGAYLHMHGDSSTEGARVKFYRLATSHPRNALRITSAPQLPATKVGANYSAALQHSGGVGGGSWSLVSGFPPKGLSLGRDGRITGFARASAASPIPHDFMARVTDANGNTYSKKFSIVVSP
jgi:hypothetical protein